MTAAVRTLAILMAIVVISPFIEIPFSASHALPRLILTGVFGGAIWAALFNYVRKGSSAARVTLTIFAGLGVLSLGATWFLVFRYPVFSLVYGAGILARSAIMVLVNSDPIRSIAPEVPAPKARPVSEGHEHDWQPHALLNDWVQCSTCNEMHAESGTVALINQKN